MASRLLERYFAEQEEEERQRQRKVRQEQVTNRYARALNPETTPGQQREDFGFLASQGVQLPTSLLRGQKQDFSAVGEAIGAPQEITDFYNTYGGEISDFITQGLETGPPPPPMTLERGTALYESLPALQEKFESPQQMVDALQLGQFVSKDAMAKALGVEPTRDTKPSVAVERTGMITEIIYDKQGELRPFTKLTPDDKLKLDAAGVTNADLLGAYGVSPKLVSDTKTALWAGFDATSILAKFERGKHITNFAIGKKGNTPDATWEWMQENLDPQTGEINQDVVIDKARELIDVSLEVHKRHWKKDVKQAPENFRPILNDYKGKFKADFERDWAETKEKADAAGVDMPLTEAEYKQILEYFPDE